MSTKSDNNRARLLHAATLDICRYGEAGARVDRIANAAELNKRLIYHYFGDKTGLADAVYGAALETLLAAKAAIGRTTRGLLAAANASAPTGVSSAERRPAGSPSASDSANDGLHVAAVIVLHRLITEPMLPTSTLDQRAWVRASVELMSLAMPSIAAAAFDCEPGTRTFWRKCERLLTPEKPRYRHHGEVRYPADGEGTR
jgi:AcrR family transcriptional regulator